VINTASESDEVPYSRRKLASTGSPVAAPLKINSYDLHLETCPTYDTRPQTRGKNTHLAPRSTPPDRSVDPVPILGVHPVIHSVLASVSECVGNRSPFLERLSDSSRCAIGVQWPRLSRKPTLPGFRSRDEIG